MPSILVSRMKNELRPDDIPEWDGSKNTAIRWFADIQEVAGNGGYVPFQLGQHLWLRLKEGTPVRIWYTTLTPSWKEWMKRHYLNFLSVIRSYYLGDRWQQDRITEYSTQRFRQDGHNRESPLAFIQRRLMYTRMLLHVQVGSAEEVREVMANAPVAWRNILVLENVQNVMVLQVRVSDMEQQLLEAVRSPHQSVVTRDNLVHALRDAGIDFHRRTDDRSGGQRYRHQQRPAAHANAHAVTRDDEEYADVTGETASSLDQDSDQIAPETLDPAVAEVYAVAARRQRPPPKGGYPYQKRDDVKSPVRPPPSPCKCCGSSNHWDRECPMYNVWQARFGKGKTAHAVEAEEDSRFKAMYNTAFETLNMNASFSSYLDAELRRDAYATTATLEALSLADDVHRATPSPVDYADHTSIRYKARVEDVPEEPIVQGLAARKYVIEDPAYDENSYESSRRAERTSATAETKRTDASPNDLSDEPLPATPTTDEVVWATPKRFAPSGQSAIGVSVVSVRGRLGGLTEREIDLRLDSCADISLLSEEYYDSLKKPPPLQQGLRMRLWQLTDRDTQLRGFVRIPVFITAESGRTLGLTLEAYVVPNMTVPVLLGEDFQLTYEATVARSVEFGTKVRFGDLDDTISACGVRRSGDFQRMRRSAVAVASFIKAKTHRRERNRRARRKRATLADRFAVRASKDTRIPPQTCVQVPVEGNFNGSDEWYLEKNLLGATVDAALAIPNLLVSKSCKAIPVANTSLKPLLVRKGDVLGNLRDPNDFLDKPDSASRLAAMANACDRTKALIYACRDEARPDSPPTSEGNSPSVAAGRRVFVVDPSGVAYKTKKPDGSQEKRKRRAPAPCAPSLDRSELPPGAWPASAMKSEVGSANQDDVPFAAQIEPADEQWGPKTAEVPDNSPWASTDLEKVIDVGDVPESIKPRVWEMLKRRVKAFGFDGRLGHLETRCRIRTKEGVEPIAVPMYGASPAKRLVIDEQLKKWFAQGVIEASESPWSAPVVIVYRNGKARFCVDYRKLNAVTIPDEFPIPRQSEILSALSGSQVLSSLDALSGFTQMEIAPEDVEKTAFRTHRGLFHFRRMPFGLRNGPSIFQRTMQAILAPYLWIFALVYIDDIIVYSKSHEEHLDHLERVLSSIEKAGLTLSPDKCHLFYESVLLLGHKVSRLGLSTHREKVRAILDLQRPSNVSELQTFLGMVVYFSGFIPYYAEIAAPLFQLLRKGSRWNWGPDQETAFEAAKAALQQAPVLGHPAEGQPYRLYTDASDYALGCCLQQVQKINVKDLKGTKTYERLEKAFRDGAAVPRLTTKLGSGVDYPPDDVWGATLDDTSVHVERVIAYWSRTFKNAETRYSATECEALAAKEGLVKFQPYIEGEKILLVTDHAALQWAKTYENANRRLAAWGAVYSAYAPGLEIIHRPGRVHSNVDPLSRLPRVPPPHTSPATDPTKALEINVDAAEHYERVADSEPARRAAAMALSDADILDRLVAAVGTRRSKRIRAQEPVEEGNGGAKSEPPRSSRLPDSPRRPDVAADSESPMGSGSEDDPYDVRRLWELTHPSPTVHVEMSPEWVDRFVKGYQDDISFRDRWSTAVRDEGSWDPDKRFVKDQRGLLFFRDADFRARLCVPKSERARVLREAHESPFLSAHAGPEKLWELLSAKYYWTRMKRDVLAFCNSCDVCQKTKPTNFSRYGKLTPHSIPSRPYESISLDLIVNLPWSGDFNAILVIVDRLSKHAQFIPTTTGLNAQGFAALFVKHVACRFGLPGNMVSDRDPRWTSDFWKHVARILQLEMLLSSSHHPQHDGQTEIVNRQLEVMLRAYVADDRTTWSDWLHLLEHAYNSRVHASTGASPYFLLYGFEPRSPLDAIDTADSAIPRTADLEKFVATFRMHRDSARRSVARAQLKQVESYNKGRRDLAFEAGDLVLVNPHSLEWVESKGEGAKLVQRWIGPFEVQQRINAHTYRLRLPDNFPGQPVFNLQHLKKYQKSPPEFGERTIMPDTRILKPANEEYEVEKIIGHRYDKQRRTMLYLVRWVGYSPLYDLWLTPKDLRNAPELLYEYQRRHQIKN